MASHPHEEPSSRPAHAERSVFESPMFDSFDGWARLLRATSPAADARDDGVRDMPSGVPEAVPWVPRHRPPMALLHVVDDGRDDGETMRIRGDSLVIGRTMGGVSIPHDPALDEAHARIDRLPGDGWLLTDLGSGDGTWVRVTTARLKSGTSLRVGSTTLTFGTGGAGGCFRVDGPAGRHSVPCPVAPFLVGRAGPWPGRDGAEGVAVVGIDDPHVSPVHAEVILRRGSLRILNLGLNGLWARIEGPLRLPSTAQFRCGEQRFVFESLAGPT